MEKTTETLTSPSPSHSSSSSSGDSFHAPSLSTLPFDLVLEILCWLPVKSLLKIRGVCKSWNSIISDDPKFARKHLHMSAKRNCRHHHLIASSRIPGDKCLIWDSPISSVFSAESTTTSITQTKLRYPPILNQLTYAPILNLRHAVVCSCHGILCFLAINHYAILWNPSVRKFKILPCLESPPRHFKIIYGFGYDHFNDNYKVIAIFCYGYGYNDDGVEVSRKTQVKVHTLGTNYWRMIEEFPSGCVPVGESGKFVSGTVNWVASTNASECSSSRFIVSLDLRKESYQEILQPDYGGVDVVTITLGVLRDCLCVFAHSKSFIDVWLMKEYGNKESWTKLFSVPFIRDLGFLASTKVVYIHEDDQVLLVSRELVVKSRLFVYDSRHDIFNIFNIQNIDGWMDPKVYVESLISP